MMNTKQILEAKDWLKDAFPNVEEDFIEDLENADVMDAIERLYHGGIDAFLKAGQ